MIEMDGPTWKVDKRDNLVEKRLKMNDENKPIVDHIDDTS
jgi:hypothetical protein